MQGMGSHGGTNGTAGSYSVASTSTLEDVPVPGLAIDRIRQFIAAALKTDKPEEWCQFEYDPEEQRATLTILGRTFTFNDKHQWPAEEGAYRAALCRDIFSDILRKAKPKMTWQGMESMIRVATVWQTIATLGPFPKGPRFEELAEPDAQSAVPAPSFPTPSRIGIAPTRRSTTSTSVPSILADEASIPTGPKSAALDSVDEKVDDASKEPWWMSSNRPMTEAQRKEHEYRDGFSLTADTLKCKSLQQALAPATKPVTPALAYDRVYGLGKTTEADQVRFFQRLAEEPPPSTAFLRVEQFFTLYFGQTSKPEVYQPYIAFEYNTSAQKAVLSLTRTLIFSTSCTASDFAAKEKEYREGLAKEAILAKCFRASLAKKMPKERVRPHIDRLIEIYSDLSTLGAVSAVHSAGARERHISISGRSKAENEPVAPKTSVLPTNANTTALPKFTKHGQGSASATSSPVHDASASQSKAAPKGRAAAATSGSSSETAAIPSTTVPSAPKAHKTANPSFPHPIATKQRFASPVAISPTDAMGDTHMQNATTTRPDMPISSVQPRQKGATTSGTAPEAALPTRPRTSPPTETAIAAATTQGLTNGLPSRRAGRTDETWPSMTMPSQAAPALPRRPSTDIPQAPQSGPTAPAAMSTAPSNGFSSTIVLPEKVAAAVREIKEKQATAMKVLEEQQKQRELDLREQARQKLKVATPPLEQPPSIPPPPPPPPPDAAQNMPPANATRPVERPSVSRQSASPESSRRIEEARTEEGEFESDAPSESRRSQRAVSRGYESRSEVDKDRNDNRQKGNYTSRRERDYDVRYDERDRDRERERDRDRDRDAIRRSSIYEEPRYRKRSRSRTRSPIREREREDRRGDYRGYDDDDDYRYKRRRASYDDTRDERGDRKSRQREDSAPLSGRSTEWHNHAKTTFKEPYTTSGPTLKDSRLPTPPASASRPGRTEDMNGNRSETLRATPLPDDRLEKAISQAKKTEEAFVQALGLISKHAKGGVSLASAADAIKKLGLSPTLQGTAQQALNDVFDALPQGLLKKANIPEDTSEIILLPRSWVQGTLALLQDVVEKK